MIQHRRLNLALGMLLGLFAFSAGLVGQAYAHPTKAFLQTRTTIRVSKRLVLGHHVRVCSWRPGDQRVRAFVRYSTRLRTLPTWAGAARHRSRAACALNGGVYQTAAGAYQYRPSGTVYAQGVRVRRVMNAPAVGFLPNGGVAWGAGVARGLGSGDIINGTAFIVSGGKPLLYHADAAWTTAEQFSCGAPGTDGPYGCSRSNIVQFAGGRVGLVEIGHASMPLAARILVQMGAIEAVTLDSGGAALMWTVTGRRNTATSYQVGHLFGVTAGTPWHRRIPDCVIVNARKIA